MLTFGQAYKNMFPAALWGVEVSGPWMKGRDSQDSLVFFGLQQLCQSSEVFFGLIILLPF